MKPYKILYYSAAIVAALGLFLAFSSHSLHHAIGFAPDDHLSNIIIGIVIFVTGVVTLVLTAKKA